MINKVVVLSRSAVEAVVAARGLASGARCISINSRAAFDPPQQCPLPQSLVEAGLVLPLWFDDIESADEEAVVFLGGERKRLFDWRDANEIARFLDALPEGKTLLVHCQAGISRSGAVAEVANEYLNGPGAHEEFMRMNPYIIPNSHVRAILRRRLNLVPIGAQEEGQ